MDKIIRNAIADILKSHKDLLKIPIRQKAKFEGWLKFELANNLEKKGVEFLQVESEGSYKTERTDISFFYEDNFYKIELKTPNANWKMDGVTSSIRPITKNIQSIIDDTKKINSTQGIIAFVLFPIPINDYRWENYINRISEKTGLTVSTSENCILIEMCVDEKNKCNVLVCTFKSKIYRNW